MKSSKNFDQNYLQELDDYRILILDFGWNSSRIRQTRISYKILQGFRLILDFQG